MAKKYIVDLNEAELSKLRSLTKTGKHKARTITRANILLMASEGYSDNAIASSLRVNVSTVERTREKFVVGSLEYAIADEGKSLTNLTPALNNMLFYMTHRSDN